MKLSTFICVILLLAIPKIEFAQNINIKKFDNNLISNKKYDFLKVKGFAKTNNSYNFMALGYFINANNIMYLKTADTKYLDNTLAVLAPILIDKGNFNYYNNSWKLNVNKGNGNYSSNGKEMIVFEGYFFRYVGEFLDIISTRNIYKEYQNSILEGLKYSFSKWRRNSMERFGDSNSLLYHLHLHTGANWATVALYLTKYDIQNKAIYSDFITQYDLQLKKALILKEENGRKYYVWNSTYPVRFTNLLKSTKSYKPIIQDVSHGNHVVVYLLKSKELNNKTWKDFNINYLVNTLELKIAKNGIFADNIDGSTSTSVKNTGWKQSDGWMKLIQYNPNLKNKYIVFYEVPNNKILIDNSMLGLQFFANLD